MHRRVLAAACGALLLIGLAADPAGAAKVSPAVYVEALCTSLGDFRDTVAEGNRTVRAALDETSSLSEVKEVFVTFFDDSIAAGEQAVAELKAAGAPDIRNGAPIATTIRKAFAGITTTFTEIRDDAEALPTSGRARFRRGVEAIEARLDQASRRFTDGIEAAEERYGNVPALDRAFEAEPACAATS